MKKVAFFDWDGTLAEEGSVEFFPGTVELLKEFISKGIQVYILTGRPGRDPSQSIFEALTRANVHLTREQVIWVGADIYQHDETAGAKGVVIKQHSEQSGIPITDYYFADDKPDYVRAVLTSNPGVTAVVVPEGCASANIKERNAAITVFFQEVRKTVLPTASESLWGRLFSRNAAKPSAATAIAVAAASSSSSLVDTSANVSEPINLISEKGELSDINRKRLLNAYAAAKLAEKKEWKLKKSAHSDTVKLKAILENINGYDAAEQYNALRTYMLNPKNKARNRTFYKVAINIVTLPDSLESDFEIVGGGDVAVAASGGSIATNSQSHFHHHNSNGVSDHGESYEMSFSHHSK